MATPLYPATMPDINTPFFTAAGSMSPAWYLLFQALFNRTGQGAGMNGAQLTADDESAQIYDLMALPMRGDAASLPIGETPGASPWTFQAPYAGTVNVQGGTVSKIEFSRDGGATWITMAAGVVPVDQGDDVRVTYSVVPTVTLIGASS